MFIRCPKCKTSTRTPLGPPEPKIRCRGCAHIVSLANVGELGSTPKERYENAQLFSEKHDIDLASAYSVLIGVMRLEETESLTSKRRAHRERTGSRGRDRVFTASKLARVHDVPMKLAFDVAAGELSLESALRQGRSRTRPKARATRARSRRLDRVTLFAVGGGVGIGCLIVLLVQVGGPRDEPLRAAPARMARAAAPVAVNASQPSLPEPSPQPVELTTDAEGQLTRIGGRTPEDVLRGFCKAQEYSDPCEPVGIEPLRPHRNGLRLGMLSRTFDPARPYAISIRRDSETREWFAGNGLKPLRAEPM